MIEKQISIFIENQFPALYREDAEEFISLVKTYFEFLEQNEKQSLHHSRRIFDYNDIDLVTLRFLLSYRNKYLKDIPFNDETIRFVIKHILDLYRRKGTKEGIELFFRLFYNEDVEIYYPSDIMLKPSDSIWKVSRYIELYPNTTFDILNQTNNELDCDSFVLNISNIIGSKIIGSISKAEAFIDNIYIIKMNMTRIPILFISDVKGSFIADDIILNKFTGTKYGKVYGSLSDVTSLDTEFGTTDNKIGDVVSIQHPKNGIGAQGLVSEITSGFNGEITFTILDGGFGYTLDSLSNLIISDQVLFLDNPNSTFIKNELVYQITSSNNIIYGTVTGNDESRIGVRLASNTAFGITGNDYSQLFTINRTMNISENIVLVSDVNRSANVQIGSLTNTETIELITDIIGDFKDVILSSNNFSEMPPATNIMSGNTIVNISTTLEDAFTPQSITIGTISSLDSIDPGNDYQNDLLVLGLNSIISRFKLYNQIITVDLIDQNIEIGDIIEQIQGSEKAIGEVVNRVGNILYVKHLSFAGFIQTLTLYTRSNPSNQISILDIRKDFNSLPAGINADIQGIAQNNEGKISKVKIIDSGVGYVHSSRVNVVNKTKQTKLIEEIDYKLTLLENNGDVNRIWNYKKIAIAILKTINDINNNIQSTEKSLFYDATINGLPLGNITQTGIITSEDAMSMVNYPNTVHTDYIETILIPYMNQNFLAYANYFTEIETKESLAAEKDRILSSNVIDSTGIAIVRSQGFSAGFWDRKNSHINFEDGNVIQDSFYYQDYSYEVGSTIPIKEYETTFMKLMHPAGIKLFNSFSTIDIVNIDTQITSQLTKVVKPSYIINTENNYTLLSENNYDYEIDTIGELT